MVTNLLGNLIIIRDEGIVNGIKAEIYRQNGLHTCQVILFGIVSDISYLLIIITIYR